MPKSERKARPRMSTIDTPPRKESAPPQPIPVKVTIYHNDEARFMPYQELRSPRAGRHVERKQRPVAVAAHGGEQCVEEVVVQAARKAVGHLLPQGRSPARS